MMFPEDVAHLTTQLLGSARAIEERHIGELMFQAAELQTPGYLRRLHLIIGPGKPLTLGVDRDASLTVRNEMRIWAEVDLDRYSVASYWMDR